MSAPENTDPIHVLLVRLESKVDTVLARHELRLDKHDTDSHDHEKRIRSLETSIHNLATKQDIEDIEQKRDKDLGDRQKRTMAWLGVALTIVVPIESAIIALIIRTTLT